MNAGFPWQWWLANWFADQLADAAAERFAVHSDSIRDLTARTTLAKVTLTHAVEVAVALAPLAKKKQPDSKASFPSEGKEEKVRRLARAAGHSLTRTFKCAKCKLQVPFYKALPHIEAVLACKCVGMASKADPSNNQIQLVNFSRDDDDDRNMLYTLGQVAGFACEAEPCAP